MSIFCDSQQWVNVSRPGKAGEGLKMTNEDLQAVEQPKNIVKNAKIFWRCIWSFQQYQFDGLAPRLKVWISGIRFDSRYSLQAFKQSHKLNSD